MIETPIQSEYSSKFLKRLNLSQSLGETFVQRAKEQKNKLCFADSLGREVTYKRALIGSILLGKYFKELDMGDHVGVLLPSTVGGALANIALTMMGKVTVNLNFTASAEAINSAIAQSDITFVVTSRVFMERLDIKIKVGHILFLEDVMEDIQKKPLRKVGSALQALTLSPKKILKIVGGVETQPDDVVTIIFSSGTTGDPKGVMLTHRQIMENVTSVLSVYPYEKNESFMGVLPFFHAFGYMATLWLPIIMRITAVYHPDPRDAKTVGEMVMKYKATFILGTPTFYRLYEKTCKKVQFASLKYAIAGAEKLHKIINDRFEKKFGIPLLEGYGCTELGPAVSVNRPSDSNQNNYKFGSVGKPLPNVDIKIIDLETKKELATDVEGLVLVKSPALMKGYLKMKTDKITRDGWYVTGDIGKVDEEGFLFLTDRLERFSKIGGEMVPHMLIENKIKDALNFMRVVVVAVADPDKGERLVVLFNHETISVDDIADVLKKSDLPNLWKPKKASIHMVDEIPVLGSGKVNLSRAKELALQKES